MRTGLLSLCLVIACGGPAAAPEPAKDRGRAAVEQLIQDLAVKHPVISKPTSLIEFLPDSLDGLPASDRTEHEGTATGTYTAEARSVRLSIATVQDIEATRASFELLGADSVGRVAGREVRGLRVQGNPAQVDLQLDAPHEARLHVVAANTYLVTVQLTPASSTQDAVELADHLAISSLTRLAIHQAKQRAPAAPPQPGAEPPQ